MADLSRTLVRELLKRISMRQIKLSGRETAMLRAIGFAEGVTGAEILDSVNLPPEDVCDVLSGLIEAGYVECSPLFDAVPPEALDQTRFEVNPSYVASLREAMIRRY